jgi:hypothetical protein
MLVDPLKQQASSPSLCSSRTIRAGAAPRKALKLMKVDMLADLAYNCPHKAQGMTTVAIWPWMLEAIRRIRQGT